MDIFSEAELSGSSLSFQDLVELSDPEYFKIRDLVYSRSGIHLNETKRSLIRSRLQKVLREKKFSSFSQYYDHVIQDHSGRALSDLITRISTNYTYFYREKAHFEYFFSRLLPEIISLQEQKGEYDLRVWSAGCSTGEEPYTLVMLMKKYLDHRYASWKAGILATDISQRVLEVARQGVYSKDSVSHLPAELKSMFVGAPSKDELCPILPAVKNEVTFRRFNLMTSPFPFKKKFQVIFCKNVMIYFDEKTKYELVGRFSDSLEKGGYLFIGHSESLGQDPRFEYVEPALYRKKG